MLTEHIEKRSIQGCSRIKNVKCYRLEANRKKGSALKILAKLAERSTRNLNVRKTGIQATLSTDKRIKKKSK